MRLIPVIDLKNGIVVRGVGGRRDEYRPIVSRITTSVHPLEVARSLIQAVHPDELYIADLDAITGGPPAWAIYQQLRTLGVALWVDAGVREAPDAVALARADIVGVVCGLETLAGPEALRQTIEQLGFERVILSLDMQNGRLLGNLDAWSHLAVARSPRWVVDRAHAMGIRRLIVLDLAGVGEGKGIKTTEFCRELATAFPEVEIYTGGGLRGRDDLKQLEAAGIAGVLVASALHDGLFADEPGN